MEGQKYGWTGGGQVKNEGVKNKYKTKIFKNHKYC